MIKNAISLFVVTVMILAFFLPSYTKMQDLKEKNRALAQQIKELQKKNVMLAQEKHKLETDPVYLEKVGREKMGLVRQGEVVYKIVPAAQQK